MMYVIGMNDFRRDCSNKCVKFFILNFIFYFSISFFVFRFSFNAHSIFQTLLFRVALYHQGVRFQLML